jgi:hypothetical protein
MFHTVRTKLNLVNLVRLSPMMSRAFSFYNALVKDSSLILGGFDHRGGGNRYQGSLLIWEFPSHHQVLTRFNEVVAMLPLGCRNCCHDFEVSP